MPLRESPGVLVHTTSQPKLIHRVVLAPEVHFKQGSDGRIVIGGPVGGGRAPPPRPGGEARGAPRRGRARGAFFPLASQTAPPGLHPVALQPPLCIHTLLV